MKLLTYLPRFRKAYRQFEMMAKREQWSRAQIEAYQLMRLNQVWDHAIHHVPYYQILAADKRIPPRFKSLAEFRHAVPVLSKAEVRANRQQFFSHKPERGWWLRTGGSTGTPMSIFWSKNAHLEALRAQYRFRKMWGIDIFDKMACLWGHSASTQPGLAGFIEKIRLPLDDWLRNRVRLSAYHLGRSDLRRYLIRMAATCPEAIYGYPSAVNLLADEAKQMNFFSDSLKVIMLTGEPALPGVIRNIENTLRVPAVIEYGSYECGFTAHEWPDRTLRVREDIIMTESVAGPDGRYQLVNTVLTNPSFPLLRYAIEDLTDQPIVYPEKGFAILHNVSGRNNDMIISRRGHVIHSARFDAFFKYEYKDIRRFRMHQSADGSIRVLAELYENRPTPDTSEVVTKLSNLVDGYPVEMQVVDEMPNLSAGKHRSVISERVQAHKSAGPKKRTHRNLTRFKDICESVEKHTHIMM